MWVFIVMIIILIIYLIKHRTIDEHPIKTYPKRQADLKLFSNGNQLYHTYFEDIQNATDYVCVSFFIVKSDDFSEHFFNVLTEASQRGVSVYLLVDRFGSFSIKRGDIQDLKSAGVNIRYSNQVDLLSPFHSLNRRNHRKITIIDGKVSYIGGFNIGDEYINQNSKFGMWRDYHLRVTGEVVQDFIDLFSHDWWSNNKEMLSLPDQNDSSGEHTCRLIPTSHGQLRETFYDLLKHAEKRIAIGSPYFIPNEEIMTLLKEKIYQEGVRVTVLYPHDSDHVLVKEASSPFLKRIADTGAEVRLFHKGFFHAKALFIDDKICDIGTANLDRRSLYFNEEVNMVIFDQEVTQKFLQQYEDDFEASIPLYDEWFDYPPSSFLPFKKFMARILHRLL
ncbi:phospholipase D-like domain-containing protein [Aquisalibacillus elongatus]|uniref:Cardiolipin synthase n=1 Tax=Aquisalibacillus elongatus TaxID=485577 RepID=A0A3N5C6W8_9BACI|nr:phospholipase D-like domain-containing protein [Aquisalibacillus elongatus]RPF54065.1 cardiolipin synthase [Aquisalibacillus elongatus]